MMEKTKCELKILMPYGDMLYCFMCEDDGELRWQFTPVALEEKDGRIFYESNVYEYYVPEGKTIDDLMVDNVPPLYNIIVCDETFGESEATVVCETEHSIYCIINIDIIGIIFSKSDTGYYRVYEEENLDFIDEL